MSVDPSTFETIIPSRFTTFTLPNPLTQPHHLRTPLLRIAVLDAPSPPPSTAIKIAGMLVPLNRESDWTFNTYSGHLQLLHIVPDLSRLILIGNSPSHAQPTSFTCTVPNTPHVSKSQAEEVLTPLLFVLSPKAAFEPTGGVGALEIPFLDYEDDVVRCVVLEVSVGPFVGEMLVEDVELLASNCDGNDNGREFRRRLRFKRMPNLIQTQVRICPETMDFEDLSDVEFRVDKTILVHPYLSPMVAGLSVIASYLNERVQGGVRPKALCLGVGGGALLGFLSARIDFKVVGVEQDEIVLSMAKKYFGLEEDGEGELIRLCVDDGIELMKKLAIQAENQDAGLFDIVMVDLDSSNAEMNTSAPPLEFVKKSVLLAARKIIYEHGVLIINVIPPTNSFYDMLKGDLQEVFAELYEIDVGNEENFVLIASASRMENTSIGSDNSFLNKLKHVISGPYIDSIKKIPVPNGH